MPNLTIRNTSALFFLLTVTAWADTTTTVDTSDRGYYYGYDYADPTNQNYLTGQLNLGDGTSEFHSFFAFDPLAGLTGPIVSATLNLYEPQGGFSSTQLAELLTITGFSGSVTTLEAGGTVAGEYNALASGTVFGTQSVTSANDGSFISIALNADGIAFLNGNSGSAFAFGGSLADLTNSDTRFLFGGTNDLSALDGNTTLTVVTSDTSPVPEPKTTGLVLIGLLALVAKYRRWQPAAR